MRYQIEYVAFRSPNFDALQLIIQYNYYHQALSGHFLTEGRLAPGADCNGRDCNPLINCLLLPQRSSRVLSSIQNFLNFS